jgi:hypothetical protein
MMVGCVAGEGHLDESNCDTRVAYAQLLAGAIAQHARSLGVGLIVLKEFPDDYRKVLSCFVRSGFTRVPSMPLTELKEFTALDILVHCAGGHSTGTVEATSSTT